MSKTSIKDSLAKLAAWAEKTEGATFDTAPAEDDEQERLDAPTPDFGEITWKLPPSYLAFIKLHSHALIKWGENEGHDELIILDPEGIEETSEISFIPEGVDRGDGRSLSTNHLVPFATGGDDECAFCFDISAPDKQGEYPVYFNHQDDPRAKYVDTGEWEDEANAQPDFPSFAAWLAWVAGELSAGREPPHSRPSSYEEMPGRSRT